jgi:hypothetical protein
MNHRKLAVMVALSIVYYSAGFATQNLIRTQGREAANRFSSSDEDDIREAVFRYQFQHNASGQQRKAEVYFLSSKDLSDEFMSRFRDNKPPVKRSSQVTPRKFDGVKDKVSGKSGLIFYVGSIDWVGENEAKVEGGYFEASLSASGNVYELRRESGKWIVVKDEEKWIS